MPINLECGDLSPLFERLVIESPDKAVTSPRTPKRVSASNRKDFFFRHPQPFRQTNEFIFARIASHVVFTCYRTE